MRSLIVGATGLIGSALTADCETNCRTHLGTWYRAPHPDHAALDVRDAEAVEDLIAELEPEAVFLAAGPGDDGYAEAFPGESREVLVEGAENVARAVGRLGGTLVLFSPADVFGECPAARKEDAPPAPTTVRGTLAADAEAAVRAALPGRHLILRAGGVFGPEWVRPRGFVARVMRRLESGEVVRAAADRLVQPTYSGDLAAAAFELLARGYTGTFHAAGPERMTEYAFAKLVAFVNRMDADRVSPTTAAELDDPRPLSAWLDRGKLRSVLGAAAIRFPADGLRAGRDRAAVPAMQLRAA